MTSEQNKTVIIIQARTGSKRLHDKVLMKLNGKTVLEWVIMRVKMAKYFNLIDDIVVATTYKREDNAIDEICNKEHIPCYRGSENDVLKRFYLCAKRYKAKNIIRITADCPLIDATMLLEILMLHQVKKNDYTANLVGQKGGFPRGFDVEVFTFETLEKAYKNAQSREEKEHVTLWITKNINKFKHYIYKPEPYSSITNLNLSIDTYEDFKRVLKIIQYFHPKKDFTFEEVNLVCKNNFLAHLENEFMRGGKN